MQPNSQNKGNHKQKKHTSKMQNKYLSCSEGASRFPIPQHNTTTTFISAPATKHTRVFSFFFQSPRKSAPRGVRLTNKNFSFKRFRIPGAIPLVEKFTPRDVMAACQTMHNVDIIYGWGGDFLLDIKGQYHAHD